MMAKKENKRTPAELPYRRPIGLFEAIGARRRIRKYNDLTVIDHIAYYPNDHDRLREKYPGLFMDSSPYIPLEQEVHRELAFLTASVLHALRRINAPLAWQSQNSEIEYDFDKKHNVKTKKVDNYNLIADRLYPSFRSKGANVDLTITRHVLNESIGFYTTIIDKYWMKLINPLWLISRVLRLPISVIEYMGVNTETTSMNRFVYWLIQALALIILGLVCAKLGVDLKLAALKI